MVDDEIDGEHPYIKLTGGERLLTFEDTNNIYRVGTRTYDTVEAAVASNDHRFLIDGHVFRIPTDKRTAGCAKLVPVGGYNDGHNVFIRPDNIGTIRAIERIIPETRATCVKCGGDAGTTADVDEAVCIHCKHGDGDE